MRPENGLATPPAAADAPGSSPRRAGFTLVELLVVVGIIAVLAGLVLTARSRASDQARSAQCMNNLRQIGLAMTMYAQSNNQAFPFAAPANAPKDRPEDWIHFRAVEGDLPKKILGSAIAPHARVKGEAFLNMMRCPADEMDTHQIDGRTGFAYRFSYSMNSAFGSEPGVKVTNRGATPRVTAINRPAEKILVVEENERTINDGFWVAGTYQNPDVRTSTWNVTYDYLSVRHDTRKAEFMDPSGFDGFLLESDKRGNVLFVDGHTEFVTRLFAHSAKHVLVSDEGVGVPKVR